MGSVGFLILLKTFHFLAWPIFALLYPLCASIHAIERNSIYNMRKWIAYWILFSFISLLDLHLHNFFDRFTLWPYMKMIAVLWLVIPQFNGAYNAYKCIIQPCLTLNLKVVTKWFYNKYFLAELERDVRENGTGALDELIAHTIKHGDKNLARRRNEAVEVKEFTVQASREENRLQEEHDSVNAYTFGKRKFISNRSRAIFNIQKCEEVKRSKEKPLHKISSSSTWYKSNQAIWVPKMVEIKEWNCTHSGSELNEHLQEEPDSTKECNTCDSQAILNMVNQKALNENPSSLTLNKSNQAIWVPKKLEIKDWNCSLCKIETPSETSLNQHLQGRKHKNKYKEIQDPKKSYEEEKVGVRENRKIKKQPNYHLTNKEYWCSYCNIWCVGEKALSSHLNGILHLSRVQEWNYIYGGRRTWYYDGSVVYHQ